MNKTYSVHFSGSFLCTVLFCCVFVAFSIGRTARIFFLWNLYKDHASNFNSSFDLPHPILKSGKTVPQTKYTSKTFDTSLAASSNSRWIIIQEPSASSSDTEVEEECENPDSMTDEATDYDDDDDDEVHLPKGQHLIVDIRNVASDFLASKERLAKTMMEVVNSCGLTLLSYHCHGMLPSGVSCVGVLLESHVSFHTYPSSGVIMFDLFTCGDASLLPIVSNVIQTYSVPALNKPPPEPVWAYKFRGFGADNEETIDQLTDLFTFPIGAMTDYKKEILSVETEQHRVDIYDVIRPHFQDLQSYQTSFDTGTFEYQHRDTFEPDRILFLDGALVSRQSGEKSFHEALIHPAMFVHSDPKRVLVIGGGYGAHLREVLKHSVEKVVVIQKDAKFVEISKQYLPRYSHCPHLKDGETCFDDSRVEMIYQEFGDYIEEENGSAKQEFDVIILDDIDFMTEIYNEEHLVQFLSTALTPSGIFVAHVGEAPYWDPPSEQYSLFQYRYQLLQNLQRVGFESLRSYEEGHGGLEVPQKFVIGFKTFEMRSRWFQSEAWINLLIQKRTNGGASFSYFDGATMQSYLYPSKISESVYCRQIPTPESCMKKALEQKEKTTLELSQLEEFLRRRKDGKKYNLPNFYVGKSRVGESAKLQSSLYVSSATTIETVESLEVPSCNVSSSYDPATDRQSGFHTGTVYLSLGEKQRHDS